MQVTSPSSGRPDNKMTHFRGTHPSHFATTTNPILHRARKGTLTRTKKFIRPPLRNDSENRINDSENPMLGGGIDDVPKQHPTTWDDLLR